MVMKVKKEMESSKKLKPLYIIHNLKEYTSQKQVEDYIEKTLLKSATFTLKKSKEIKDNYFFYKSGLHFFELLNDKEKEIFPNIFHLIYANEYSDAGKIYNQYALDFIGQTYQNYTNIKAFDAIETIKERYINISKDIIEKSENYQPLTKNSFDDSNPKIIKLKDEKEIILRNYLFDELGFSNFKNNGFEPKYNIYTKDNKIIIKFEIPGNFDLQSKIEIQGEYNIIKIYGEKKIDKEPAKIEQNIYNSRESGKYILEIPLKFSEYRLRFTKPKLEKKQGICILEYDLDTNDEILIESGDYESGEL